MRVRTKRLAAVYSVCLGGLLAVVIVPTAMRALDDGATGESSRAQIASPAPVDPAVERQTVAPARRSASSSATASASATTISTGYSSTGIVRPIRPAESKGPAATVPATVRNLHVLRSDRSELVVGWSSASRATAYQVYLNGYPAATVTGTSASLRWHEDGAANHYVEVLAVNAGGQVSKAVAFLEVVRPAAPTEADPTDQPTKPDPTEADPTGADPTDKPTAPATTRKPTSGPTSTRPTKTPTSGPTSTKPTKSPTKPTQPPTEPPSQPPTTTPSQPPSQEPSEPPTEEPSQTPSEQPSEAPSQTASASDGPGQGDGKGKGNGKGKGGLIDDLTGLLRIG